MATVANATEVQCHIELASEVDVTYRRELRGAIQSALDGGASRVIVDCRRWKRIDVGILSTLIRGARACDARGTFFELAGVSTDMRADIAALRLGDRLFR
jgi:anti-anti-sigma regulatory factor